MEYTTAREPVVLQDPKNTAVSQLYSIVMAFPKSLSTDVLATLLNDGTCPTTGKQILKPETVQEMFKNQIPQFPDFGRNSIPAAKPYLTNPIPDLYPQPPEQAQGWGLTFMLTIHPGATGRGNNTGWWAGLPNLFWWCDREEGIAGMICTQILPFAGKTTLALRPVEV